MHETELESLGRWNMVREVEVVRVRRGKGRSKWAVLVNGEVLRSAALPIRPFASLDTAIATVTSLANWSGVCTVTTQPTAVQPDENPYPRVGSPGYGELQDKWTKILAERYGETPATEK